MDKKSRLVKLLEEMPSIKKFIDFPDKNQPSFSQERYTQAIVNLLIESKRVASAAGFGSPTNDPLKRAKPESMLTEIEVLLGEIEVLISFAQQLIQDE
jgi:hypothetical protein